MLLGLCVCSPLQGLGTNARLVPTASFSSAVVSAGMLCYMQRGLSAALPTAQPKLRVQAHYRQAAGKKQQQQLLGLTCLQPFALIVVL